MRPKQWPTIRPAKRQMMPGSNLVWMSWAQDSTLIPSDLRRSSETAFSRVSARKRTHSRASPGTAGPNSNASCWGLLIEPSSHQAPSCRSSSRMSSMRSSNAASWRTGFCACVAATVATTSWWRSPCGFCPSCGARRMAQTAAHLVDHAFPRVPVRQWVLSLPIPLRLLLAAQPQLLTPILQVVHRVITRFLLDQAGLKGAEADSGAVTLIQRFGSDITCKQVSLHRNFVVVRPPISIFTCTAWSWTAFIDAAPAASHSSCR